MAVKQGHSPGIPAAGPEFSSPERLCPRPLQSPHTAAPSLSPPLAPCAQGHTSFPQPQPLPTLPRPISRDLPSLPQLLGLARTTTLTESRCLPSKPKVSQGSVSFLRAASRWRKLLSSPHTPSRTHGTNTPNEHQQAARPKRARAKSGPLRSSRLPPKPGQHF